MRHSNSPDNIILHTGTNDLRTIDTTEEITMGILNLAVTCKTDTNSVFVSGIVPRSDKLNEKASKVNSILRHECNVRNICFTDNKHISQIPLLQERFTFELLWNKEVARKYFIRISKTRLTI